MRKNYQKYNIFENYIQLRILCKQSNICEIDICQISEEKSIVTKKESQFGVNVSLQFSEMIVITIGDQKPVL